MEGTVTKIGVHHIVDGIHTNECESIFNWDTEYNKDLKKNIWGDYGLWQCPYCKCVREDTGKMIDYETYKEWYL